MRRSLLTAVLALLVLGGTALVRDSSGQETTSRAAAAPAASEGQAAGQAGAAGAGAPEPAAEEPVKRPDWGYMTALDARSGGTQHYAFVSERNDPYGRIYVQCAGDGRLYVFVTTQFLGRAVSRPPMQYQIDKHPPVSLEGVLSNDARAVFFSEGRGAFLKGLRRGRRVRFMTLRDDGYAVRLGFSLDGSDRAIKEVLEACDYDAKTDRTPSERAAEARAAAQAALDARINSEFSKPKTGIVIQNLR